MSVNHIVKRGVNQNHLRQVYTLPSQPVSDTLQLSTESFTLLSTILVAMEPHSPNAAVLGRLTALEPRISRILAITGIPGCSIGVVHQGVEIWKFNVGHRDVENKLPPPSDTSFH
jgi:hypothetical protein